MLRRFRSLVTLGNWQKGSDKTIGSERLIVFLHLEKTAGTTFNNAMNSATDRSTYSWYSESQLIDAISRGELKDMRAIAGHFPYGVHRLIARDCKYFSLIRNPIDRIESWYYYQQRAINDAGHKIALELDINQWIDHLILQKSSIVENFQSMRLLGFTRNLPSSRTAEHAIIRHVQESFFYVAPHEKVCKMGGIVAGELGLVLNDMRAGKVATNKPRHSMISSENRERLSNLNQVDLHLHNWVSSDKNHMLKIGG